MTESFGNPSSGHAAGRKAGEILAQSREKLAKAMGCGRDEIFFTSGGTEADNWAILRGAAHNSRVGRHIITSAVEHDAVLKACAELERTGYEVQYIPPDSSGRITAESVAEAIREDTALISVMMVNNETGCIFPISEIAAAIKRKKSRAYFHVDAVQGFLKVPFKAKNLGADMISVSSHKIHGPKGCGALYIRRGLHLPPLIFGGGQENGYRSGTEAVPAIAGFAAAAECGYAELGNNIEHMRGLKEQLKVLLAQRVPEAVIIGNGEAPHILSLSMPKYKSEVIMNYLDAQGICVSKGSACKKGKRSHVLEAMGISKEIIDGSIRISLCPENTEEEMEYFVSKLCAARDSLLEVLR